MANTVSTDALRREAWAKELLADEQRELYFAQSGMMGKGSNYIIEIKDDLAKDNGDTVTFGLTTRLGADTGVTGDNELEGNESALTPYSQSVTVDQWRDAVRLTGKMDEQKNAFNMRMDAKEKLKIKRAEFIEQQTFLKLGGVTNTSLTDINGVNVGKFATWSNTPAYIADAVEAAGTGTRYVAPAATTAFSQATHIMTTDLLDLAALRAKTATPKIRPIRINGKSYYIVFMHPHQAYDLKQNAVFAQARREAEARGSENPIFTGALGIWNGLVLHEHEMCPFLDISVAGNSFRGVSTGTDCAADAYRAILCGAQAAVFAKCKDEGETWIEETFDYGNQVGFATVVKGGIQKTVMNSKEYGTIVIDTTSSITVA